MTTDRSQILVEPEKWTGAVIDLFLLMNHPVRKTLKVRHLANAKRPRRPGRPTPFRPSRSAHTTLAITSANLVYEHYLNHNKQSRQTHEPFRGLRQAQGLGR